MRLEQFASPALLQRPESSILIVDDEPAIRELGRGILRGYRVLDAEDGVAALRILEREPVDVILTDVMMPNMNGLDLLAKAKEIDPAQIVVMMTGYSDRDIILRSLKLNADDFISKPINLLQLKTTIEKVLEKKKLREELAQLKRLDRLKSDFLGLVSHKLKTPTTAISLFIQNLQRCDAEEFASPDFHKTVAMIFEEANYLNFLIKDLLYYSEVLLHDAPSIPSTVDVEDLISALLTEMLQSAAGKGIALESELDRDCPPLQIDPRRFGFALRALVENAVKFTPRGGRIHVDLRVSEDCLRVFVRDNGQGIPREELPKVFEKFYQVDPEHTGQVRGFGLGLFYARQFVRAEGGNLHLESTLGEGTTATLILPLHRD